MGKELSTTEKKLLINTFLKNPTKSDIQISKIVPHSLSTVKRYRKEYSLQIDTEFVAIVAGKFILEFGHLKTCW